MTPRNVVDFIFLFHRGKVIQEGLTQKDGSFYEQSGYANITTGTMPEPNEYLKDDSKKPFRPKEQKGESLILSKSHVLFYSSLIKFSGLLRNFIPIDLRGTHRVVWDPFAGTGSETFCILISLKRFKIS